MNDRIKKITLVSVCVLVVAGGIFFVLSKQKDTKEKTVNAPTAAAVSEDAIKKPAPTKDAYQQSVNDALAPFVTLRKTLPPINDGSRAAKESAALRIARDRVLALTVPGDARDLHLELVLALTQIEQGILDKNAALWQQGETTFDVFVQTHSWVEVK